MPCKRAFPQACIRETVVSTKEKAKASEAKTRWSCIPEAHESTRQRGRILCCITSALIHSDAASDEDSRCKAAADKEWKKLETIPAWDVRKVKS